MNWSVVRILCACILVCAWWEPVSGQNYYLVVGAFAAEGDVHEITSFLPETSSDTSYSIKSGNNLMHFYVLKTSSRDVAIARSLKLQEQIEQDALPGPSTGVALPETTHPSGEMIGPSVIIASAEKSSEGSVASGGGLPPLPRGQYFKFAVTRPDGSPLPVRVHHVDFERERELDAFDSYTYVDVLPPMDDSPMAMVCGVFGYKEIEKYIDYKDPSETEGAYLDENGAWVVPYSLTPLEKGDVSIMYNVSFHENAVTMTSESKQEMDALVAMMVSNPRYVIKVHSHCNGRKARTITVGADYFALEPFERMKASAKKLTNLRAESVRRYLVENGIEERRIKIYGWGGSGMLVAPDSPHARLNDRIEIEILKD